MNIPNKIHSEEKIMVRTYLKKNLRNFVNKYIRKTLAHTKNCSKTVSRERLTSYFMIMHARLNRPNCLFNVMSKAHFKGTMITKSMDAYYEFIFIKFFF
jgi:hypothetical protein